MNPHEIFCPNIACPARGQTGKGNIGIHSQKDKRYFTAFIEQLNATFRQRLDSLARRTRTLVCKAETLEADMYIIGCLYNFCDPHHSLRLKLSAGRYGYRWVQRTPAIASGLVDHIWSPTELFNFKLPLPRWVPPKQRGRRSPSTLELIDRWCS